MINITIDNQQIEVAAGSTVLEACQDLGINIPTMCYHKSLPPYGSCRLCLVEVEERGRGKIQASCIYQVQEGMVVRTNTEQVLKTRRIMAELLLARCPESEAVIKIASELGVTETRFPKKNEHCILCGQCVRVCSERMKQSAVDFTGRGVKRKVAAAYDKKSDVCMACGACQVVCPVDTIKPEYISTHKPRPLVSDYDAGLVGRSSIYIPYQQAIPKVPVIDRETCMHFRKEDEDACGACAEVCGAKAIDYTQQDEIVDINVGAVVLAPGYSLYDANERLELGIPLYPNVLTSLQFERIQSASGPTGGHILRPSDNQHTKHIAFIQCVGSRDAEHNYCSSVCCMYATKEAIITKEHEPDVECTIFYMDLRAFGKGFDAYYERAKELGVRYIRCRPAEISQVGDTGNLLIRYEEEGGSPQTEEFSMVVLSVGLNPPKDASEIAESFGIALDEHGFAKTNRFTPVNTSREGVFVCGPFSEPKDIPETVVEASAAAANAMSLLSESRGANITEQVLPPERDVRGQTPRIGVFVCHCGRNIGAVVNVPKVVEYALTLPNVVYAEHNLYTCSTDTQDIIKELIDKHNLNRVVVASCTPRTHEPLFRDTVREAGLNPYLFEMANIRDQCSWVHMELPEKATEKAKELMHIAVAKARQLQPLQKGFSSVDHNALVIGGGISGMTAALNLADQGFNVHLVEKTGELGGNFRDVRFLLDGSSPTEKLAETIQRTEQHANI
ncbi:2Fe-2S iron-sulfur cluster-binding protein, partial [Planctomycetota bacterium]